MRVKHIFGGGIYLISNFGVARNPIFRDKDDLVFFEENISKYLQPLCEIYAFAHTQTDFQYLIKIKDRKELESFALKKRSQKVKNIAHDISSSTGDLPESYEIFSQEVSNCLNSYAKRFNFKHKRIGGLFAGRYSKEMIESEEEMEMWVKRLHELKELRIFANKWKVKDRWVFKGNTEECSSEPFYRKEATTENLLTTKVMRNLVGMALTDYKAQGLLKLRGYFEALPPISIKDRFFTKKFNFYHLIHGTFPPW